METSENFREKTPEVKNEWLYLAIPAVAIPPTMLPTTDTPNPTPGMMSSNFPMVLIFLLSYSILIYLYC